MDTFNNNVQNNQNTNKQEATDNQEIKPTQNASNQSESNKQNDAPSQTDTTDYSKVALEDRTSTENINNHTRNVKITEKDGTKISAQLQAPKLRDLQNIQDSRYGALPDDNGQQIFRTTTSDYYEHLFPLFHNVTVNAKPDIFGWDFGDAHYEAFTWLINQASTFLGDAFNTNN